MFADSRFRPAGGGAIAVAQRLEDNETNEAQRTRLERTLRIRLDPGQTYRIHILDDPVRYLIDRSQMASKRKKRRRDRLRAENFEPARLPE